jgi:hypothetical protein
VVAGVAGRGAALRAALLRRAPALDVFARDRAEPEALARVLLARAVFAREDFRAEVFVRFPRAAAPEAFFLRAPFDAEARAVPRFDFAAFRFDVVRERDLLFFRAAIGRLSCRWRVEIPARANAARLLRLSACERRAATRDHADSAQ